MFKSVFTKYFSVMSLIIIISFIAMGGVQMFFNSQYWVEDKQVLLSENTKAIHARHKIKYDVASNKFNLIVEPLETIEIISHTANSYIFLTDSKGDITHVSQNVKADEILNNNYISQETANKFHDGFFWEIGDLEGMYNVRCYTYGKAVYLEDFGIVGYIFASSSASGMTDYLKNNLKVFFFSAIGVLALSFIIIYLMTYNMVRPLRQMSHAASRFGQGDFTARVDVRGQDEIAELANAFNSMAVSLASAESVRRNFIANVSHELKTPMTTIGGFVDGILDGTIPQERYDHYLTIVSNEIKRLSRLVNSMLDLSHIENTEMKINTSEFDLTELTVEILMSFEQKIKEKNINVTGIKDSPASKVVADYDLIGQVIYNLMENAVKFVDKGGTLTIRVYKQPGRTFFSVRNTGAGVHAQEMPHIFERFYKSDKSRSLDKSGMGLGLYIVKTIITLHSGEIAVRSVEGDFCEFEFWLPDKTSLPASSDEQKQ